MWWGVGCCVVVFLFGFVVWWGVLLCWGGCLLRFVFGRGLPLVPSELLGSSDLVSALSFALRPFPFWAGV